MERKVVVTEIAKWKLENLFVYLEENWSVKVKADFIKKLDKNISLIISQPELFPESDKESGLRKCVVTKQTTLFFKSNEKEIHILTVFDNRQDPDKFKI